MVDRYTRIVLTVIAVMLTGLLVRSVLEPRAAVAQGPACGAPANPCAVNIVGGPAVAGAWQGAPIYAFDAQAELRAREQPPCGRANDPCYAVLVGGPPSLQGWQGAPLIVVESVRILPRSTP